MYPPLIRFLPLLSLPSLLLLTWAVRDSLAEEISCFHLRALEGTAEPAPANANSNQRQYARSREIDVKHLRLDLDPDFEKRSLTGKATLTFAPIATALSQLRLDSIRLHIQSVESTVAIRDWNPTDDSLWIYFAEAIPVGQEVSVTIRYEGQPQEGWYFRTEAMGYPAGDDHFWTQGEPDRHRQWFPGYDYPNERFTSEVFCRVPKGMTVLSNGHLVEERAEEEKTLFHWLQDQPHPNYLISVVGGYFKKIEKKHGDLPLAFYTTPSEIAQADNSFRDTDHIIAFFEKEIGVKYPWDKYYYVAVADFIAGGMENTSITTVTDKTLFTDASENLYTTRWLDAHEAAHQWFGDLITCKDWSQLWLNEGFATYYMHLYDEEKLGTEQMRYRMWLDADKVVTQTDEKPIVWKGYQRPLEQFDYRVYPKGGWVLHMLRCQVGPDLYRKIIRSYLESHRNGNVETHDLIAAFEEMTGKSWDQFFDQWVFHGGVPKLKIAYSWDDARSQARLSIQQTQKVSDAVLFFDLPLPVRFIDEKGTKHDFTIRVRSQSEDFYFDLPSRPRIARIDPESTVLAAVDFTPPTAMLHKQLANEDDMMGRLLAVRTLAGRNDATTTSLLGKTLTTDAFYGVRIEAAEALAKLHSPEALDQLAKSRDQSDARVRRAVINAIDRFYHEVAYAALKDQCQKEKNPDILADALLAMAKYPKKEVQPLLLENLQRESYRNRIAFAAAKGLGIAGDTEAIPPLLQYLRREERHFQTSDFGDSLHSLASLASTAEPKDREEIRLYLLNFLQHPKMALRISAMKALAELGDLRSLPALRSFADTLPYELLRENRAANEAIQKLSDKKPQSQEVTDLRQEVLDLQSQVKQLRTTVETAQKQKNPTAKK